MLSTHNKPKRKRNPRILFKLKLLLVAFIVGMWIATFFPMIWLSPPLFELTPFVYIGLSLLWIPIMWRTKYNFIGNTEIQRLILCCLVSSILMTGQFHDKFSRNLKCSSDNQVNEYYCSTQECDSFSFIGKDIGGIMVVQDIIEEECIFWFGPLF